MTTTSSSVIECTEQTSLPNGRVQCDRKNYYGSVCRFICDVGFGYVDRSLEYKDCRNDANRIDAIGRWSSLDAQCLSEHTQHCYI